MIHERIKDVWKAIEAMEEEAFEGADTVRRQSLLNIAKYLKNDIRMIAHQYNLTREDLVDR